jgi:molybdenum cofactor biosynthesis protein MoaC
MVDITIKHDTLRKAVARAELSVSSLDTIDAIRNRTVPKGDVFEFSRAAGLLAVKNTASVIPDCHPLPIEYTSIRHEIDGMVINIFVEVHTIYKTGVEVEAMHGASIVALTMYDMLKPIDKDIRISNIRLESKIGGKTGYSMPAGASLKAAVVTCSDTLAAGRGEDISGKLIVEKLLTYGIRVMEHSVLPDDAQQIRNTLQTFADQRYDLVIFTGGTGLSPRDITPDTVGQMLEREIPGLIEAARNYGQRRTPYAMLSRGVAGFIGKTLVMTFPGSPNAAAEYMDALFPYVLHLFKVAEGDRH